MRTARDALRGPYGPDGAKPPKSKRPPPNPARKEREELLALLTEHVAWPVLVRGLNQRRSRLISALATGRQMELWEIRSIQDRLALLSAFVRDPVTFLLEFDTAADGETNGEEPVR